MQVSGGANGYFTSQAQTDIILGSSEGTATDYFVNQTSFAGNPDVPQLAYSLNGQDFYGAWVADSTNGFIIFRNGKAVRVAQNGWITDVLKNILIAVFLPLERPNAWHSGGTQPSV